MSRPRRTGRGTLALLLALAGCMGSGSGGATPTTRTEMRRVYDALSTLLPIAISPDGWPQTEGDAKVREALGTLADSGKQLAEHGSRSDDVSFRFLSQSLENDARQIQQRVSSGRYESASYITQRVVETCVACHLRLPARTERGFAEDLIAKIDQDALTPLARAKLQAATRQFDAALDTYEAMFADPRVPAPMIEFTDALPSYFIIALRVKRDPERAQRGLAMLASRPELPEDLEKNRAIWSRALEELGPALKEKPTIARARQILAEGEQLSEFPADGNDRLHAVVASSLLYRFIEEESPHGGSLAEALCLLGETEAFTRRSFELSEAEHYFEQAIRLAPNTPTAARAYATLEKETLLGYTGSSGVRVPDDVRQRLAELKAMSGAPASAPPADAPEPAQRRPDG
jgi:tetratricopeptide (TPR) repeat protein